MANRTPTFRNSVGSVAMQSTYNTIVFDYYPMVSIPDRPVFWDARYSQEWASGKVAYEHNKILSSGIGASVIKVLDKKILGSNLIYKKGKDTEKAKETVDFIRNKCNELKFDQVVQSVDLKRLAGGSAYFVLNPDFKRNEVTLDAIGIDQAYVTFKGLNIDRARIFINFIDDNGGRSIGAARYYIIEDRYFKDGKPYAVNRIYKSVIPQMEGAYSAMDLPDSSFNYGWRDDKNTKAEDVTDMFGNGSAVVSDYVKQALIDSGLIFGYEFPLPFKGLGIAHCKCTSTSLRHPNSKYGDPLLIDCYDLLWTYDYTFSILAKDVYVGRPITFIPDTINGNKVVKETTGDAQYAELFYERSQPVAALFDDEFVKVPNYDMEWQTPTTVQYDIRSEKLKIALDDIATQIAHNTGVEPQALISELRETNETKTAFEIANDTSIPNTTVLRKRALLLEAINEIVNEICYFYKKSADDVCVCFPPLEELNKTLTADYIVKLRSVKGMSDEMLVDMAYKELTEAEKQEEIDRIKQLKEEEKTEMIEETLNKQDNNIKSINKKEDTKVKKSASSLESQKRTVKEQIK